MRHWLAIALVMGLAAVNPGAVGAAENLSQREGLYELFDRLWDWQPARGRPAAGPAADDVDARELDRRLQ